MARSGPTVVYLVGTAGNPHYGDEVITAGWLRYYADRFPDAEIWLDTPRPGQTAVLHSGTHPNLRCVDTLFHAAWNAPSEDPQECLEFGRQVIDEPGRIPREASGVAVARRADLVHVLGGGYINGLWPKHLTLLGAAARLAEVAGARSAVTGAGLTPAVPGSGQLLAELCSGFDVVDVRDEPTAELLAGAVPGLTATGDDAFLDLQRQRIDSRSKAAAVVEVQSDLIDAPLEDLADYVVRSLRSWGLDQQEVLLLESLPPNDLAVREMLAPHLPRLQIMPFEPLWHGGFPLVPSQAWITTRFHSHLMASAAGAWGVALGASPVIASQHESLLAQGSEWALVTDLGSEAPKGHPTRDPFSGRFAGLVSAKRQVADTVVSALA